MALVSILSVLMRSFLRLDKRSTLLVTPHRPSILQLSQHPETSLDAIDFNHSNPTASTDTDTALLRRLAHQSEPAMTRADIESIGK